MLTDEVTLTLIAGHGGRGAAAFNKVRLNLGPTGGDGGRGGDIYFEGVTDLMALGVLAPKKEIKAKDGGNGRGQFIDGKDAEPIVVKVPIGTRITNLDTGFVQEIGAAGERLLAVGGGAGGRGNFKFRSSTNTSPRQFEEGTAGDRATFRLELRLIADVGLVGLPNAGKSSLLNALTSARSKVGDYPFTTLEPNLGSFYGLILADIPGLIEGASEGRGLGHRFLKHVERTRSIFHLVSAESNDPVRDYHTVRAELERYSPALAQKKEYVFLTKSDALTPPEQDEKLLTLRRAATGAIAISILDDASLEKVRTLLRGILSAQGAGKDALI